MASSWKTDFLFTAIYGFAHFAVDLACVSAVVLCGAAIGGALSPAETVLLIVGYDIGAFAFQMPIGALMDKLGCNARCAIAACLVVMAGVGLAFSDPAGFAIAAVVLAALGNAVFHCAGGIDVLNVSGNRASLPGAFIAPGAMGVFLAPLLVAASDTALASSVLVGLLLLSTCLLLCLDAENSRRGCSSNADFALPALTPTLMAALALLFATIAIRSYAGASMGFPWKADVLLAGIAVSGIVLGKTLGGFVADRLGTIRTSALSLGAASILFLFSWDVPACGVVATSLFNFTMPITLSAMARLVPGAKGLAFGTASFALAIGFVPVAFGFAADSPGVLCALSLASLVALVAGLKLAGKEPERR